MKIDKNRFVKAKERLPDLHALMSVYAVIAFIVYSWAIVVFLWNLSAWLFYLYLGEILVVFAYRMVASLVESVIVLIVLLGLCFALPAKLLKDAFVLRGTSTVICILGSMILFWNHFLSGDVYFWMIGSILLAILFGFLSTRVRLMSVFLRWLSDSLIVFLYILMPLSLVSLVTVVIRNVL